MSKRFIDTNVLVYAYDWDAGDKHLTAREVLKSCWQDQTGAISTQVLQEFYVTVTRTLPKPLPKQTARDVVRLYNAWPVYQPSLEDIMAASQLEEEHKLSFWDALIVISAGKSGADTLISEDLQAGCSFGQLQISNPFTTAP